MLKMLCTVYVYCNTACTITNEHYPVDTKSHHSLKGKPWPGSQLIGKAKKLTQSYKLLKRMSTNRLFSVMNTVKLLLTQAHTVICTSWLLLSCGRLVPGVYAKGRITLNFVDSNWCNFQRHLTIRKVAG